MITDMKEFARNRLGAAAVEFAMVLPVFLVIALGILAYGIYFGASHSTSQLAADAARSSVAGLTDEERATIAKQHVAANAPNYPLLKASKIIVEAGPLPEDATQFRVSVRYAADQLPIWGFASFLPLPSRTIVSVATVKRGGF